MVKFSVSVVANASVVFKAMVLERLLLFSTSEILTGYNTLRHCRSISLYLQMQSGQFLIKPNSNIVSQKSIDAEKKV